MSRTPKPPKGGLAGVDELQKSMREMRAAELAILNQLVKEKPELAKPDRHDDLLEEFKRRLEKSRPR
ncbi:hypothetical protein [Mesorhizobium huakuii]|uniref:Uncharacterized protein n=1 Tax=Mesorhizobium huakuii TaxID=28104 RepID=A0A7G6T635_9HYPH|nr:hypothetical protein [Mesorhizobium huakuii]QND62217.1 hypothetical protein HB778_39905 [Mesorhizobium huakuii]